MTSYIIFLICCLAYLLIKKRFEYCKSRVSLRLFATAIAFIQVFSASRTKTATILSAEDFRRHFKEHLLEKRRRYIEFRIFRKNVIVVIL